jgi:hypothetical protein
MIYAFLVESSNLFVLNLNRFLEIMKPRVIPCERVGNANYTVSHEERVK